MTKAEGSPQFDGVAFGEAEIKVVGFPSALISVKFALVNSEDGRRFGSINKNMGWSEETTRLFEEFAASLERDAVADLFEGGGVTTTGSVAAEIDTGDGVPGL